MSDTGGNYNWTWWKCDKCGAFIPYGQSHACGIGNSYPAYQYYFCIPNGGILERIAKALEEISDAGHACPICGKLEAEHERVCPKDDPEDIQGQPALKSIRRAFCDKCNATTCAGCPLENVGNDK